MAESRVSGRYAKSLVDLAKEINVLDNVAEDMRFFVKVASENRELMRVMQNPIITSDKKLSIIEALFKGRVNDVTLSLFAIVIKKNRESLLFDIAQEFIGIERNIKGIKVAEITTTFPLSDNIREDFREMIFRNENTKKVEIKEKIDKNILGGYILKIGDRQIDESVLSKLQKLKNKFKDNSYISKY